MKKLAIKDQYNSTWLLDSDRIESVEDVREVFNSDDKKTRAYTFNLTYIDADDNKHRLYLGAIKCVNDIESFIQTTELRSKLMNILNDETLNIEVRYNKDILGLNDRYGNTLDINIDDIVYYEDIREILNLDGKTFEEYAFRVFLEDKTEIYIGSKKGVSGAESLNFAIDKKYRFMEYIKLNAIEVRL